jgi:hypothetical protein
MSTATCRVRDLKPGMGRYDERLNCDIRVERVEIDGDMASVWLSSNGREAVPFPYDADAEIAVDVTQ